VQEAHGEYCAVIDSDDWYPLRALERMVLRWREIPLVERERFANVEGLCTSKNGTSLSSQSRLPQPILDADNFSIIARYHVFDDKMGMYRTKVLREFPFPAHANKFIPEDTVFFQIAERYRSRFVDEVWGFKEYLPSGLSKEIRDKGSEFAYGFRLFNKTVISLQLEKPTRMLFKAYVNFVRYSLHEGIWLGTQRSEVPSTPGWLLAVPFGAALYLRDRWRTSRQSDRSS